MRTEKFKLEVEMLEIFFMATLYMWIPLAF